MSKSRKTLRPWPAATNAHKPPAKIWDIAMPVPKTVYIDMLLTSEESLKFWSKLGTQVHISDVPFMQNSFLTPSEDGLSVTVSPSGARIALQGMCTPCPENTRWPGMQESTTTLTFGRHSPTVQAQRCIQLGQTITQCVTAFMARMSKVAGSNLPISMEDLASVGGEVLLSPTTNAPVCRDYYGVHMVWLNKINVSMCVRDGFLTHTDKRVLHDMLPLVVSLAGKSRTLVITEGAATFSKLEELKPKSARHAVKAAHTLCVVSIDLIRELEQEVIKAGKRLASYGKLSHKTMRQKMGLSTFLFDLPWDTVISCCQVPVILPAGHDIGFWWTLCTPNLVVGNAWDENSLAPLSTVHAVSPKMRPWEKRRLNQHRMVNLSRAINDLS
jgi:hypothetical protein